MKNYIVSLVMARTEKEVLPGAGPSISLHNVVGVTKQSSPEEAYEKVRQRAILEHPGHNIAVKVVIEMDEALEHSLN